MIFSRQSILLDKKIMKEFPINWYFDFYTKTSFVHKTFFDINHRLKKIKVVVERKCFNHGNRTRFQWNFRSRRIVSKLNSKFSCQKNQQNFNFIFDWNRFRQNVLIWDLFCFREFILWNLTNNNLVYQKQIKNVHPKQFPMNDSPKSLLSTSPSKIDNFLAF